MSYSSIPLWKVSLIISDLLLSVWDDGWSKIAFFFFNLDVGGLPLDVVILCDFFMVES